jgi:hypothetical protein
MAARAQRKKEADRHNRVAAKLAAEAAQSLLTAQIASAQARKHGHLGARRDEAVSRSLAEFAAAAAARTNNRQSQAPWVSILPGGTARGATSAAAPVLTANMAAPPSTVSSTGRPPLHQPPAGALGASQQQQPPAKRARFGASAARYASTTFAPAGAAGAGASSVVATAAAAAGLDAVRGGPRARAAWQAAHPSAAEAKPLDRGALVTFLRRQLLSADGTDGDGKGASLDVDASALAASATKTTAHPAEPEGLTEEQREAWYAEQRAQFKAKLAELQISALRLHESGHPLFRCPSSASSSPSASAGTIANADASLRLTPTVPVLSIERALPAHGQFEGVLDLASRREGACTPHLHLHAAASPTTPLTAAAALEERVLVEPCLTREQEAYSSFESCAQREHDWLDDPSASLWARSCARAHALKLVRTEVAKHLVAQHALIPASARPPAAVATSTAMAAAAAVALLARRSSSALSSRPGSGAHTPPLQGLASVGTRSPLLAAAAAPPLALLSTNARTSSNGGSSGKTGITGVAGAVGIAAPPARRHDAKSSRDRAMRSIVADIQQAAVAAAAGATSAGASPSLVRAGSVATPREGPTRLGGGGGSVASALTTPLRMHSKTDPPLPPPLCLGGVGTALPPTIPGVDLSSLGMHVSNARLLLPPVQEALARALDFPTAAQAAAQAQQPKLLRMAFAQINEHALLHDVDLHAAAGASTASATKLLKWLRADLGTLVRRAAIKLRLPVRECVEMDETGDGRAASASIIERHGDNDDDATENQGAEVASVHGGAPQRPLSSVLQHQRGSDTPQSQSLLAVARATTAAARAAADVSQYQHLRLSSAQTSSPCSAAVAAAGTAVRPVVRPANFPPSGALHSSSARQTFMSPPNPAMAPNNQLLQASHSFIAMGLPPAAKPTAANAAIGAGNDGNPRSSNGLLVRIPSALSVLGGGGAGGFAADSPFCAGASRAAGLETPPVPQRFGRCMAEPRFACPDTENTGALMLGGGLGGGASTARERSETPLIMMRPLSAPSLYASAQVNSETAAAAMAGVPIELTSSEMRAEVTATVATAAAADTTPAAPRSNRKRAAPSSAASPSRAPATAAAATIEHASTDNSSAGTSARSSKKRRNRK